MHWVIENWLLLLVGGGLVGMHVFGHGHGRKGGHKDVKHGAVEKTEAPRLSKENTDA